MRARGRRLRLTKEGSSVRRPHPPPPPRRTRVASAWASRLLPAVAAASAIEVALVLTPSCTCRKERGASGKGNAEGPCCQSQEQGAISFGLCNGRRGAFASTRLQSGTAGF